MPHAEEITAAAARSAKATKSLDTMRARILKADEARTDAAKETIAIEARLRQTMIDRIGDPQGVPADDEPATGTLTLTNDQESRPTTTARACRRTTAGPSRRIAARPTRATASRAYSSNTDTHRETETMTKTLNDRLTDVQRQYVEMENNLATFQDAQRQMASAVARINAGSAAI